MNKSKLILAGVIAVLLYTTTNVQSQLYKCQPCSKGTYSDGTNCKKCTTRDSYATSCNPATGYSTACKTGYTVNSMGYCASTSTKKVQSSNRSNSGGSH